MKRQLHFLIIILAGGLLLGFTANNYAGDQSIGAIFLNEPVGARAAAMGEAFVGVAEDANTVFWNPAGMVHIRNIELLVVHTEFIQNFRDEYFAFSLPLSARDAIGINGFFSYTSQLEKATSLHSELQSFNAYDAYLSLAWSRALAKHFSAGLSLKVIYQVIDSYSAWTMAGDLSFLMTGIVPDMTVGLTLKNLGMPIIFIEKAHPLPMIGEVGVSYWLLNKDLLLTLDMCKPFRQEMSFKFGTEYNFGKIIFLRAGYKYLQFGNDLGPLSGLTCGLGAEISDYKLDYAFTPYADLGNVHRVSVTFPFGRNVIKEKNIIRRLGNKIKVKQKSIIRRYMQTAERYLQKGDYKNAIYYYDKTLMLNPGYPGLKKKIYQAKYRLKTKTAAKHFRQGLRAYKQKDYLTALIEWSKAHDIMPAYKELKKWLKRVNQKLTYAKNKRRTSQGRKSTAPDNYFSQGLDYLKKGEYRKAINTWNKLLTQNPGDVQVKKYLKKAKKKMKEEIEDLLQQAKMYWQGEDAASAVRMWRQILKIDPENQAAREHLKTNKENIGITANALYLKGVKNYVENKLVEAISNWEDVLVLDPKNQKAADNLERTRKKLKDIKALWEF